MVAGLFPVVTTAAMGGFSSTVAQAGLKQAGPEPVRKWNFPDMDAHPSYSQENLIE
jgi:hypothetical protein